MTPDSTPADHTSHAPVPAAPRPGGTSPLAGRTVSRVGYGAMQLERLRTDPSEAIAVVRRAVELGIDHIDTAQFYGDGFVNDVLRQALRPTDGVLVASKVGADPDPGGRIPLRPAQRPEQLRASVDDNLRSLGLECVPLVNLRRLDAGPGLRASGDQVVDLDDQLATMTALRTEGKIGAIGLSSVTLDGLRRALPADIACVQNAYSLVARADEDLLALCASQGIAWVPFFPLGGAFPGMPKVTDSPAVRDVAQRAGATPAQVGLAWLLHHAPQTLLIPGTADSEHLQENTAAGSITLDQAALRILDAVPSASTEVPLG